MSFLNKIKLNYNIKLIDDYISNKNNDEIYNILKNTMSLQYLNFINQNL